MKLAVRLPGATADEVHPAIEFKGDVQHQLVDVLITGRRMQSYELAALGMAEVKAEIDAWLTGLSACTPV